MKINAPCMNIASKNKQGSMPRDVALMPMYGECNEPCLFLRGRNFIFIHGAFISVIVPA
jgi:hypothetical protein